MALFKKKKDEGKGKKPVKIVDRSKKVNEQPKNLSMWCSMHNCSKTSCPKMHH